jgi:hypothetical protein
MGLPQQHPAYTLRLLHTERYITAMPVGWSKTRTAIRSMRIKVMNVKLDGVFLAVKLVSDRARGENELRCE